MNIWNVMERREWESEEEGIKMGRYLGRWVRVEISREGMKRVSD